MAGKKMRRPQMDRKPQTRLGGAITFGGVEYASNAELERALTDAVVEAGWRVTAVGEAYLAGYREAQGKVA